LPTILSITQTGYIPGRQANDNSRLLEEVIHSYKNTNNIAYLITLDAKKAFDSVDHSYLTHILGLFGFPPNYIRNVKTIYNDLHASILVNGFTSDNINIEQSVKQGDALSCALFIIAIEPLLRQINSNSNIKGITLTSDLDSENFDLKNMTFADDITALCTNLEGIQHIIDEYVNFSKYSGIKLNIEKTEIMVLGKKSLVPIVFNIKHENKIIKLTDCTKVKICGITFSNNEEEAYNDNIISKISKLERHLNIWKQRNLTLQGKILIVKTFGISQLIYSLQATSIRNKELTKIEDIIFRFVWNTKVTSSRCIGRINRNTIKASMDKGGLKAPDITIIDKSIKLKNIVRCMHSDHPISIIVKNELKRINFQLCKFAKCKSSTSSYIQSAVETNKKLEIILANEIKIMANEVTGINSYYYQLIQNHKLISSELFNPHMQSMINRLKTKGINTIQELHYEKENPTHTNIRLDCLLVYSKIPESWRTLLRKSKKSHADVNTNFSFSLNKAKPLINIKQKEIYIRLSNHFGINDITNFINSKHELNMGNVNKVFSNIKSITSIKALQNVQYKLLHNVYPTQMHLCRWKIKENDLCAVCNVTETLKHAIYECNLAKESIKNFEFIINRTLNVNIKLTYADVLLGISTTKTNNVLLKADQLLIDELLIIIKRAIILQRENKRILSINELIMEIKKQLRIRKIMGKKPTNFENLFDIS